MSRKTSFVVDLGDVALPKATAERLQASIEQAVLGAVASLDLTRERVRVGRIDPSWIGLQIEGPGGFKAFDFEPMRTKGSRFRVDLGALELSEESLAGVAREVTSAAVLALADVDYRFDKAGLFGRLGPGTMGYILRDDWKVLDKDLKAFDRG